LLDLAIGQEALVALPLSYWPTGSQAKSLANCVEGVEPTSSRVVTEVTRPSPLPTSSRFSKNSRREESRAEQRGDSPASFHRRSNSSPHHPGYSDGNERLASKFELLASYEAGGFSMPHLSGFRRSALLGRSNACLHHTGSFVAGIRGSGHDQCSIHVSYSGSPEGAALVGLEPTTFGADVTQALHHATNFSKDLLSLSHCFFAFLKNANTRSLGAKSRRCSPTC